ncbi:hypothetical protein KKA00_09230 [bacterium]|nr:hypothetical protein [bacterium]
MNGKSMYLKYVVIILIIISALSIISDTGQTQDENKVSEELLNYLPYDVGQWRQYDRSYWSIEHGSAWVEEITQTVVGSDEVLDGRFAYILKDEGVSYDSIWVVFVDDEIRRYEDYPEDYKDYKVLLKEPVVKGNWWNFNHYPVGGDSMKAFIVETGISVDNFDMTFDNCVHVYAMPYHHFYFKLGIGIVRSSEAKQDSLTGTDDELLNWEIE